MRNYLQVVGIAASLALPAVGYAQDASGQGAAPAIDDACYSLDQNDTWAVVFSEFTEAYSLNDFKTALEKTTQLRQICSRSPVLNFAIAQTYNQLGDKKMAVTYIRNAITNTKEFSVSDELVKRMYDFNYELEHADEFAAKQKELEEYKTALKNTDTRLQELTKELESSHSDSVESLKKNAKHVWIAGAIVGGVGIAAVGAGAGFLAYSYFTDYKPVELKENNTKAKVRTPFTAGWALLGVGLGLTAAGAVMAGIGGYQYTHITSDDVTLSWGVSPKSVDFTMRF